MSKMTSDPTLKFQPSAGSSDPNITQLIDKLNNISHLTCYDAEDLVSAAEFLYIFSSTIHYVLIVISVIGVLMNAIAIYILSTIKIKSMKNVFNSLITALFCLDTIFLISYVFLSVGLNYNRTRDIVFTVLSRLIKLLYSAAFNASIFMTVGISHERYIAMRHPLIHHQLMESKKSRRLRFIKYLLPILFVSCLFVVPEYMDVQFVWEPKDWSNTTEQIYQNGRYISNYQLTLAC